MNQWIKEKIKIATKNDLRVMRMETAYQIFLHAAKAFLRVKITAINTYIKKYLKQSNITPQGHFFNQDQK